jgi:hypothetical protein
MMDCVGLHILVVGQVKCHWVFLQTFVVVGNGAHEEAHRFGGITSPPLLARLF